MKKELVKDLSNDVEENMERYLTLWSSSRLSDKFGIKVDRWDWALKSFGIFVYLNVIEKQIEMLEDLLKNARLVTFKKAIRKHISELKEMSPLLEKESLAEMLGDT